MPYVVDWPQLVERLTELQRQRGLSDRALARELGFSHTILCGLRRGERAHGDTVAAIVTWLYPDQTLSWVCEAPPKAAPSGPF